MKDNKKLIDALDLSDSKWAIINGQISKYKVTKSGRVFRLRPSGKFKELNHFVDRDGYHRVVLHMDGIPYTFILSRLVAETYIPNPENKPQVNHISGNKDDNSTSNLEWATAKENIVHAHKTGLAKPNKLENHPNSVYTNEQIKHVCELLQNGNIPMSRISIITGVSYTVVKQVRNHIIWNDISKDYDFSNYCDQRHKHKERYYNEREQIAQSDN